MWRLRLALVLFAAAVLLNSQPVKSDYYALIGLVLESNPDSLYSSSDESVRRGLELYARWINEHGGIQLYDSPERVFVNITIADISAQPSTDFYESIQQATTQLITENDLDAIVGPFAGFRAEVSFDVWVALTNRSIPFLAPAGCTDVMTNKGREGLEQSPLMFSSAVPEIVRPPLIDLLEKIHEPCKINMIARRGPFWGEMHDAVLDFLNNGTLWVYPDDPSNQTVNQNYKDWSILLNDLELIGDDGQLSLANFKQLMTELTDPFDVLIVLGVEGFESSVYNQVFRDTQPTMKAVIVPKPIDQLDTVYLTGYIPDNWIFGTSFHIEENYGQPGKYMGTTEDFFEYYEEVFNEPMTRTFAGFTAGTLVSWQLCVERSGSKWRNVTELLLARSHLSAFDATAETFWGRTQYDSFGLNIAKRSSAVQYVDGELRLIKTPSDIEYPAKWSWREEGDDEDDLATEDVVGIVVGGVAGFLLILLIAGLLGVLVYLVVRKKWHMILLPKGDTNL